MAKHHSTLAGPDLGLSRRISQAIGDAGDAAQVGRALVACAAGLGVDVARLLLFAGWDDGRPLSVEMAASWTADGRPAQPEDTRLSADGYPLLAHLQSDEAFVVQDVSADERLDDRVRQLMAGSGVASFAVVPLRVRGRWLGAYFLGRYTPATYTDEVISIAWMLAGQAASAIQHAQTEQALSKSVADITRSEAEQRALITSIPDGIYFKDLESRFTRINPWQAALLGLDDPQDAIGKTDFDFFPRVFAEQALADERHILETRQPVVGRLEKLVLDDGEVRWLSATKLPMTDEQGRLIGLVGMSRDVTELKAAQDAAQRRANELRLASDIAQTASSVLDPDRLVQQAVRLIRDRFELYYVGLFLVVEREDGDWAVLRAAAGEAEDAARQMVAAGHRLQVGGQSMIGWCIANAQARIALDVGEEPARFDNPLLPETRSELALPLASRGRAIGALTIQSSAPAAFSDEDVAVLQTMADQLGNAISNARLFRDRERQLAEMAVVNDIGQALSTSLSLDELLDVVYQQVGRLFDTSNFYIATHEAGSAEWCSALHLEHGVRQPRAWRAIEAGLTSYVLRSREPLLFGTLQDCLAFEQAQGTQVIGEKPRSWLVVPLIAADECVGAISIQDYDHDYLYDEHDVALFTTVASQVAVALDNMRLLEAARRRAREMEAINEAGRAITSELNLDTLLRQFVDITKQYFGSYFVSLLLVEGNRLIYREGSVIGDTGIRLEPGAVVMDLAEGPGLTADAVRTGRPVIVHDVLQSARYMAVPELASTRSEMDVPIRVKGKVIGVLDMQADRPHAYDATAAALLQSLADQAGVAIENARLFQETAQRTTAMQALYNVALRLGTRIDTPDLLREMVTEAVGLLDAETGGFYLYDPETESLVFTVAVGYLQSSIGTRLKRGEGLSGQVFELRKPRMIEDYQTWEGRAGAYAGESRLHALLAVPVLGREGVLGVLDIASGAHKPRFTEQDVWLAELFAAQGGTAIENARLFQETQAAAAETARLYEAGRQMTAAHDIDDILAAVLAYTRPLDLDRCLIALLDDPAVAPAQRLVEVRAVWDRAGQEAISLGNRFGPRHVPPIETLGPADTLVIEDFGAPGVEERMRATFRYLGVGAAAIVPLSVGGRLLGWLLAETIGRPRRFHEQELDALRSIAGQAAAAMSNLRLLEETRVRAQELAAINDVGRAITSVLDLDAVLAQISDIVKARFGYYYVGIGLIEGDQITHGASSTIGDSDQRLPPSDVDISVSRTPSLMAEAARTGRPVLVHDVSGDPRYLALPQLAATRAELDVPIIIKDRVIGVLGIQSDRPLAQPEAVTRLVQALADQAGVAIENARLFASAQLAEAEQRRRSEELAALHEASIDLAVEQRDLSTVLDTISQRAMALLHSDGGGVWLWREDEQALELVLDYQVDGRRFTGRRLKPGEGLTGRAFAERKVQVIDDYLAWTGHSATFGDAPFMAGMAAPMIWQNRAVGALVVTRSQRGQPYGLGDQSLAELLAAQATAFIQNARLFEEARLHAQELDVLNEMGQTLTRLLSVEAIVDSIQTFTARLMDATNLYVALYDAEQDIISFPTYIEGDQVRRTVSQRKAGKGMTEHVLRSRQPLLVKENTIAAQEALGIESIGTPSESWLGVPMLVGDRPIGVIAVQSYTTPGVYDEHDRDLLTSVASQAAIAIQNARLFEERQRTATQLAGRVHQLDCLSDIGRRVQETPPVSRFLTWLSERLAQSMQFPELCTAAVEYEGELYGQAEALDLPRQMVHGLRAAGRAVGRVVVAYRGDGDAPDFLDEESALLGEVVRRVNGFIENRRLLEETEQATRRLGEERTLLRTLIDNLPDAVFVKDADKRFILNNRASLASLGAAADDEVIGQTDFDRFSPELAAKSWADESDVIGLGQPLIDHEEFVAGKQGEGTWRLTTKVPLRDSQGRVTGLVGIGRDITQRKQAEDNLRRRGAQLECLSDIGQRIGETPPVPEFLSWVAGRIPAAMQYPELCQAAIEMDDQAYGAPQAAGLPCQIVQALHLSGRRVGRLIIAYTEPREFLDEESALIGDIARRVAGYVETQQVFHAAQARAAWESRVRAATDRIRRGTDMQSILRIGMEELGQVLDTSTLLVRLGTADRPVSGGDRPVGTDAGLNSVDESAP